MEGNLQVRPGDVVRAGISFTMPGTHLAATVQFAQPTVAFVDVVYSSGSGGGSFSVTLGSSGVLGPFSVAQNDSDWLPTGDQGSAASYQGALTVPDLCGGGTMSLRNGGTFTADVQSSNTADVLNLRFQYAANGSSGSWSATESVVPDALSGSPVPVGTIGLLGLTVIVGFALVVRHRRSVEAHASIY